MKAKVLQENLSKALNIVTKAVSNKPTIPILSNVLLSLEQGYLNLTSTDLETGIKISVPADVDSTGSTTINARLVSEYINSLPSGKVSLELNGNILNIQNDQSNSDFSTISASEFPDVPVLEGIPIEINLTNFHQVLTQTVIAAATDDSRPVLTGLLFEIDKKDLTIVGVDGFRLSRKIMKIEKEYESFSIIIPAKALNEVIRTFISSTSDDLIQVYYLKNKNQIIFKHEDIELSSRLLEGEFPPYKTIIPESYNVKFEVDKESLASKIKIVSVFAKNVLGNKTIFAVDIKKKILTLKSIAAELGENKSIVDISDAEGESYETAFNAKYLSDMVNCINGDDIIFQSNGVNKAAVFLDKNDDKFTHIIMPMRLE